MLSGVWFGVSHVLQRVGTWYVLPSRIRVRIWRAAGVDIASSAQLASGVSLLHPDRLAVGERAFIGTRCVLENHALVTLEHDVWVGPGTMFATATHDVGDGSRRAGEFRTSPITVRNGTWIGASTTILPGVTIGSGCVVAAGSVVTHDCAADGLYAGVPATRKRTLP